MSENGSDAQTEKQRKIDEVQRKFSEVYVTMQNEIASSDPRSYDKALSRLEESMMWTIKGIENGYNEQR